MTKELRRSLEALTELFAFIDTFIHANNICPGVRHEVGLALEELFVNAVTHGGASEGEIVIELSVDDKYLVACFRDRGSRPFDIDSIPTVDPGRPIEQIKPGGLGLHLTRSFMDSVSWRYETDTNVILLKKRLET